MNNIKFGDRVKCRAYIKRSKKHYVQTEELVDCYDREIHDILLTEDFHSFERYDVIPAEFQGIYVGSTLLGTSVTAEYIEPEYGNAGYLFETANPKEFAIVYYRNNRKHLVPIEKVEAMA